MILKRVFICVGLLLFSISLVACQSDPITTNDQQEKQDANKSSNQQIKEQDKKDVEQNLVREIYQKAKTGKMYGVEKFPLGTSVQDVLKTWGTPESGDPGYLGYQKQHQCDLIAGETKALIAIISYHTDILELQVSDVKKELGESNISAKDSYGQNINSLNYQAGAYKLYFYYQGNKISHVYLEK